MIVPKTDEGYKISDCLEKHQPRLAGLTQGLGFKRKPNYTGDHSFHIMCTAEALIDRGLQYSWASHTYDAIFQDVKKMQKQNTNHCPSAEVLDRLLDIYFPSIEQGYEHVLVPTQQAQDRRRQAENSKNSFRGPNYITWQGGLGIDRGSKQVTIHGSLIEPGVLTSGSEPDTDRQEVPADKSRSPAESSRQRKSKKATYYTVPDPTPGDLKRDSLDQTEPPAHTPRSIDLWPPYDTWQSPARNRRIGN